MLLAKFPGVVCTLLLATAAEAQVPYLLRDLTTAPIGSGANGIVSYNGFAYYQANRPDVGRELWRSDGTAAGTTLVLDIRPGAEGSAPDRLAVAGGKLFFFADDGSNGLELWRSDAGGTAMVRDFAQGAASLEVRDSNIVDMGGIAYFLAGVLGTTGLYRSDGTASGTWRVAQICDATCAATAPLVATGSRVLFGGFSATTGFEPWSSDGTPAGTGLLRDLLPGPSSSLERTARWSLSAVNNLSCFIASDGVTGFEPWCSDGTPAGTRVLGDLNPGSADSMSPYLLHSFGAMGGFIWFEAFDGTGPALWRSDGASSARVGALPAVSNAASTGFFNHAGLLYFVRPDGAAGVSLWRTDGTDPGTFVLGAARSGLARAGTTVLFSGVDPVAGGGLWTTDGSVAGTRSLVDFVCCGVSSPVTVGASVFFSAPVSPSHQELWVSDGTAAGTRVPLLINGGFTLPSDPDQPAALGDEVCFRSWSPMQHHRELWCSDGTVAATRNIALPCATGECFSDLYQLDRKLLLQLNEGRGSGYEPWASDGTPAGLIPLGDLCPVVCGSSVEVLSADESFAVLSGVRALPTQRAIWRTDGTSAGTFYLHDLAGLFNPQPRGAALGGIHYFANGDSSYDREIWRTDGTGPGTFEVVDLHPGEGSRPEYFTAFSGRVFFAADDGVAGRELWSTNGTGPGTQMVADLRPGIDSSSPQAPVVLGDRLFFYADDDAGQFRFWSSDGSAAGTIALGDSIYPFGPPVPLAVSAGGLIFFMAGIRDPELWRSDGTASGTAKVLSLGLTTTPATLPLVAAGGRVWFVAEDPARGRELWSSDGTPAGTGMVMDIQPGPLSAFARDFPWLAASATHLLFAADDGTHGTEPWAVALPPGSGLLRNDDIRALDPLSPARASVWPLDAARDRYRSSFVSGDADPEVEVLSDRRRPLISYALDGPGQLKLSTTPIGQVLIDF